MKINYLLITIFLFLTLGCKEAPKQDDLPTEANTTEQDEAKAEPSVTGLKQNGDYSSLFNSPDCKVITAEEISTALGVAFTDLKIKGFCTYKSQFSNNRTWNLGIVLNDMSQNDMQGEIESFKSDETGLLALEISETGDTYFCIQHSHGYLSIYNTNYSKSVLISYGSVGESRGFSKEERLEHRDLAIKLANTLLKKHQK